MEAIFVNPRRRRRRTPPRGSGGRFIKRGSRRRRRNAAPASTTTANPRRRRRRRYSAPMARRRRRRNPGGLGMFGGFAVQDAVLGAVGGAAATAAVRFAETQLKQTWDPRVKAAATLVAGALLAGAKMIPANIRRPMATGAQITGATSLLRTFAPQFFGAILPFDPLAVQYRQPFGASMLPPGQVALGIPGAQDIDLQEVEAWRDTW